MWVRPGRLRVGWPVLAWLWTAIGSFVRYLLAELLAGSSLYTVEPDGVGFVFRATSGHLAEFTTLVRLASDKAGDEYLVFPTFEGAGLYSAMYVVPLPSAGRPDAGLH